MEDSKRQDFTENVKESCLNPYREYLKTRKPGLVLKRLFDLFAALVCIAILIPLYLVTIIAVKLSSPGPVFFLQERVGTDGRLFKIIKFRTMRVNAQKKGNLTVGNDDPRITPIGNFLRVSRIDEFPQFFNVLKGDMSIIGVRPEIPFYFKYYTPEDYATLLLRPGMTSPASILFRHENEMLKDSPDPEAKYRDVILPAKMEVNRRYIREFSFLNDMKILGRTSRCVFQKDENLEKFR